METLRKGLREFRYGLTQFAFIIKEFGFLRALIAFEIVAMILAFVSYKRLSIPLLRLMVELTVFIVCVIILFAAFSNLRILWSLRRLRKIFLVGDFLRGWKVVFLWNRKNHMDRELEIARPVMKYLTEKAQEVICLLNEVDKHEFLGETKAKRMIKRRIKKKFWNPWTVARECGIDVCKSINEHASMTWLH